MTEQWLPVVGYEGRYEISDCGRVRSLLARQPIILSPAQANGYPCVVLYRDGRKRTWQVHLLIARAFIGPCPEGQQVRHLDGVRHHSVLRNLAYGTQSQNNDDAVAHGTNANTAKHACPIGHPYDDTNTIRNVRKNGRVFRQCRRCHYDRLAARRRALKERAA